MKHQEYKYIDIPNYLKPYLKFGFMVQKILIQERLDKIEYWIGVLETNSEANTELIKDLILEQKNQIERLETEWDFVDDDKCWVDEDSGYTVMIDYEQYHKDQQQNLHEDISELNKMAKVATSFNDKRLIAAELAKINRFAKGHHRKERLEKGLTTKQNKINKMKEQMLLLKQGIVK